MAPLELTPVTVKGIKGEPLPAAPAEQSVYKRLRELIARGECPPGTVLRERRIAARLGVSRTPVREALARLEVEGFVQRGRGGGVVVARLSKNDARELFLLRRALTELLATEAALARSPRVKALLERHIEASKEAVEAHDVERAMALFREFDDLLGDIARIPRAKAFLRTMRDQLAMIGGVTLKHPGRLMRVHEEHRRIAEAVIRGDVLAARDAAAEHIRYAQEAFFQAASAPPRTSGDGPPRPTMGVETPEKPGTRHISDTDTSLKKSLNEARQTTYKGVTP